MSDGIFGAEWDGPQLKRDPPSWETPTPTRHGYFWSECENQALVSAIKKGMTIPRIAVKLARKESAIWARLSKLGLAEMDVDGTWRLNDAAPTKKEHKIVNMNHLITLLQTGYTTVSIRFSREKAVRYVDQLYTYKIANSVRKGLIVDDLVVVPAKGEMKVAWVTEIHDKPKIDVKAPYALQWVVCRVDMAPYLDQIAREAEAVEKLENAERLKAQNEALAALLDGMGSREEFLKLISPE